jgi:hypothetical protein
MPKKKSTKGKVGEFKTDFTSEKKASEYLLRNYSNPRHPLAFSGIQNVYKYFKGYLKLKTIKELLAKSGTYTLFKDSKKPKPRNPTFVYSKRYSFELDLIDVQKFSKQNSGINHILTCIDIFTRKAFLRGLKQKTAALTLAAFKEILGDAKIQPQVVSFDHGREFVNKKFKAFCNKKNIRMVHNDTSFKNGFIERFNLTIQRITYKYMSENQTYKYMDQLQNFAHSYNSRHHSSIKMSPNEAENPINHMKLRHINELRYSKIKKQQAVYAVGTLVRIAKLAGKFARGYEEHFNEEVFRIYKINTNLRIPLYHLESQDSEEKINAGFQRSEITPVDHEFHNVEVLERDKNRVKVHWVGYPERYDEWVDITNTRKYGA